MPEAILENKMVGFIYKFQPSALFEIMPSI